MIVGVDLDGVGYRFDDALRLWAHMTYDIPLASMGEPEVWDYPVHQYGWTQQEFYDRFNEAIEAGFMFSYGTPYDGFVEGLHALRDAGHFVHIVTARGHAGPPGMVVALTAQWLAEWGAPYDAITFCKDKTAVRTDYFIEDKAETFHALRAAGVQCFLQDRRYNRNVGAWQDPTLDAYRVFCFTQFVETILNSKEIAL